MAARPYDNALRQEQADLTRRRILDAVRDVLMASPAAFSIPAVAARAGVSEPTVYRHFPNREALLEAASEAMSTHLGAPPLPLEADDIPIATIALAQYFADNAAWLRAAINEPALRGFRMTGRRRRLDHARTILEPRLAHLEPREREVAFAAFSTVGRVESWDYMTRELGLTSEEAGRAKSWIMRALLDALAAGRRQKKTRLVDEQTLERGRHWGAAPRRRRRKQ